MARNLLRRIAKRLLLFEKARSTMPMHTDRRRRGRSRRRHSDLDWFAEDPWGEPDLAALESDAEDDWYPGLWEPSDDDDVWEADGEAWSEDPYDGWGPVRPRRKRPSDAR